MNVPPLAIIQARMGSHRLPGKVLLPFPPDGEPILHVIYQRTVEAFGEDHTVVAYPATPDNEPIERLCVRIGAKRFAWPGPENDVLARYHACAHTHRWHPSSVIVRVTADDPFKTPEMMRRVANGERLPVEFGAEAFTLAMLDAAYQKQYEREHITRALFAYPPPPPPPGPWTVDTHQNYEAACREAA